MRSPGVIKILSDLVAVDSQSYKGNKKIIALLKEWFKAYETTTQDWIREEDDVSGQNLIVKIPGKSSEHSLVIVCHTDTVPVSDAWETDPFILEEQAGNLYGLGTCDTKGGIAAVIDAILSLEEKPLFETYLVFDGDEEVDATGAKKYKKSFKIKNPQFIFIEPTENNIMIAQRGVFSAKITTHGVAQHASLGTPTKNDKENAVYIMNKVLNVLIDDAKDLSKETDSILGSNSQNIGIIHGGTAGNVIPSTCEIAIDRRILPSRATEKEIKRLKSVLSLIDRRIKITDIEEMPAFLSDKKSGFIQEVKKVMQRYYSKATLAPFVAWSEAGLFRDYSDVIILGPGSLIGQGHKANEYVNTKDVFNFVKIFRNIIAGPVAKEKA